MRRLFLYYKEEYRKKEERMPKTLLWENAKLSLPGSPCHCRCYAIALRSVAVVAVALVTLPPARHTGAASGEKQFQQRPKRPERLVRPDAQDANFFFPDA